MGKKNKNKNKDKPHLAEEKAKAAVSETQAPGNADVHREPAQQTTEERDGSEAVTQTINRIEVSSGKIGPADSADNERKEPEDEQSEPGTPMAGVQSVEQLCASTEEDVGNVCVTFGGRGKLGFKLAGAPGAVHITSVQQEALRSVIEPGMIVVQVAGQEVHALSLDALVQRIQEAPRPLEVKFMLPARNMLHSKGVLAQVRELLANSAQSASAMLSGPAEDEDEDHTAAQHINHEFEAEGSLGIVLRETAHGICVSRLLNNELRDAIKPGMIVEEVAGQPVEGMTLSEVVALIGAEPRPLNIRFFVAAEKLSMLQRVRMTQRLAQRAWQGEATDEELRQWMMAACVNPIPFSPYFTKFITGAMRFSPIFSPLPPDHCHRRVGHSCSHTDHLWPRWTHTNTTGSTTNLAFCLSLPA